MPKTTLPKPQREALARLGAAVRRERMRQGLLELLGICERTIRARRAEKRGLRKRVRTPFPENPQTLGQHIHRRRLDAGLTQGQLAARWGVCRAILGLWEADHCQPQGEARAKVATFVGFGLSGGKEACPTAD